MNITADAFVKVDSASARWRRVGDSIVVMDLTNSAYFAVEGSVAQVWPELVDGATIASLAALLAAEFSVDVAEVQADLVELCGDLDRRGVVSITELA